MSQALRISTEVAPPGIDVETASAELAAVPGVRDVHDLQIWTLTRGMQAAAVHIVVDADVDWHSVLDQTRHVPRDRYRVTHPTVQLEPGEHVEEPLGL